MNTYKIYNGSTGKVVLTDRERRYEIPPFPGKLKVNEAQYLDFKKSKSFVSMLDRGQLSLQQPGRPGDPILEKEKPGILKPNQSEDTRGVHTNVEIETVTIPPVDKEEIRQREADDKIAKIEAEVAAENAAAEKNGEK